MSVTGGNDGVRLAKARSSAISSASSRVTGVVVIVRASEKYRSGCSRSLPALFAGRKHVIHVAHVDVEGSRRTQVYLGETPDLSHDLS